MAIIKQPGQRKSFRSITLMNNLKKIMSKVMLQCQYENSFKCNIIFILKNVKWQ